MRVSFPGAALLAALATPALSAEFTWLPDTPGIVVNETSLSQTVDGITVTASGYVAELGFEADNPGGATDATVVGPFPTSSADASIVPFGIDIRGLGSEQLGLNVDPEPGADAAGSDSGGGGAQPGFDSGPYRSIGEFGNRFEKFDFALFEFSTAVDIGSVVVDDTSNFPRDAWFAYGTEAPDFTGGFLASLEDFSVLNSSDDATDGLFEHVLNLTNISYLMVGAPPSDPIGELVAGGSQFYIDSFSATVSDTSGGGGGGGGGTDPNVIPVGPTLPLLASAFALLAIPRRNRSTG